MTTPTKIFMFITAFVASTVCIGCASTDLPPSKAIRAYSGSERPDAELATLMESDDVWITELDTQRLPGPEKPLTPKNFFDMKVTYAISPGRHALKVEYQGVAGTTPVISYDDRAIEFVAETWPPIFLQIEYRFLPSLWTAGQTLVSGRVRRNVEKGCRSGFACEGCGEPKRVNAAR